MRCLLYTILFLVASLFILSSNKVGIQSNTGTDKPCFNYSDDSIIINLPNYDKKRLHVINDTIDLLGLTWYLPPNLTLLVEGGLIKNGIVVGNNTTLNYKGTVFDKVNIKGTWIVSDITTSMFADLSYENALKDVFALSSPNVNNTIKIDYGCYRVSAVGAYDHCIDVSSNTNVVLDGIILLTPNSYEGYSVLYINGSNIHISGKGSIIGDKFSHLGKQGEWGMGITISDCQGISVKGLSVKDCWGDCIYITGASKDVEISGCLIDNGRRQGISIISATKVYITNCIITNVRGTAPQYAIDVEPNSGDAVDQVHIVNVSAINCQGGIMCYGRAEKAKIGLIEVRNCTVKGAGFNPIYFQKGERVLVEGCSIVNNTSKDKIVCDEIDFVSINNNIIKEDIKLSADKAILVGGAKVRRVSNNIIY